MAQNHRVNYYTNPAFCQQSELYTPTKLQRCSSMRESPIGAISTSPQKFERHSSLRYYQQRTNLKHRYEPIEMNEKELEINQQIINELKMEEMNISKSRYTTAYLTQRTVSPESKQYSREHRYATIPTDDELDVDTEQEVKNIREMSPNRVYYTNYRNDNPHTDHNGNTPPKSYNVSTPIPAPRTRIPSRNVTPVESPKKYNPIATQKLHELLSTPKKSSCASVIVTPKKTPKRDITSPLPSNHFQMSPNYPIHVSSERNMTSTPKQHSSPYFSSSMTNKGHHQIISPKAQQKLQYFPSNTSNSINSANVVGSFNLTVNSMDNNLQRNTAVIQPIRCNQSVYSETTFSGKSSSNSWTNLSSKFSKDNSNATLAVAALMMILCGALTSGFCFYMISVIGRKYYLDFALISGFTCFVLGLLGFRTRSCRWLPNRNYISGYIVLSMFSLLTCAGLLVLLGLRPKAGSPLADVTSGAVCGISALTLLFASLGVLTSYCCKYPPPDNRVEHCAPGFTV